MKFIFVSYKENNVINQMPQTTLEQGISIVQKIICLMFVICHQSHGYVGIDFPRLL